MIDRWDRTHVDEKGFMMVVVVVRVKRLLLAVEIFRWLTSFPFNASPHSCKIQQSRKRKARVRSLPISLFLQHNAHPQNSNARLIQS
jgi:hypothetical protein